MQSILQEAFVNLLKMTSYTLKLFINIIAIAYLKFLSNIKSKD